MVVGGPSRRGREVRAALDPAFETEYPALAEYMTLCLVDGKDRLTSTLIVSCDEGRWKGCLSDRESNNVLWRSADTFQGLLEGLESVLASGKADWREKRDYKPKSR